MVCWYCRFDLEGERRQLPNMCIGLERIVWIVFLTSATWNFQSGKVNLLVSADSNTALATDQLISDSLTRKEHLSSSHVVAQIDSSLTILTATRIAATSLISSPIELSSLVESSYFKSHSVISSELFSIQSNRVVDTYTPQHLTTSNSPVIYSTATDQLLSSNLILPSKVGALTTNDRSEGLTNSFDFNSNGNTATSNSLLTPSDESVTQSDISFFREKSVTSSLLDISSSKEYITSETISKLVKESSNILSQGTEASVSLTLETHSSGIYQLRSSDSHTYTSPISLMTTGRDQGESQTTAHTSEIRPTFSKKISDSSFYSVDQTNRSILSQYSLYGSTGITSSHWFGTHSVQKSSEFHASTTGLELPSTYSYNSGSLIMSLADTSHHISYFTHDFTTSPSLETGISVTNGDVLDTKNSISLDTNSVILKHTTQSEYLILSSNNGLDESLVSSTPILTASRSLISPVSVTGLLSDGSATVPTEVTKNSALVQFSQQNSVAQMSYSLFTETQVLNSWTPSLRVSSVSVSLQSSVQTSFNVPLKSSVAATSASSYRITSDVHKTTTSFNTGSTVGYSSSGGNLYITHSSVHLPTQSSYSLSDMMTLQSQIQSTYGTTLNTDIISSTPTYRDLFNQSTATTSFSIYDVTVGEYSDTSSIATTLLPNMTTSETTQHVFNITANNQFTSSYSLYPSPITNAFDSLTTSSPPTPSNATNSLPEMPFSNSISSSANDYISSIDVDLLTTTHLTTRSGLLEIVSSSDSLVSSYDSHENQIHASTTSLKLTSTYVRSTEVLSDVFSITSDIHYTNSDMLLPSTSMIETSPLSYMTVESFNSTLGIDISPGIEPSYSADSIEGIATSPSSHGMFVTGFVQSSVILSLFSLDLSQTLSFISSNSISNSLPISDSFSSTFYSMNSHSMKTFTSDSMDSIRNDDSLSVVATPAISVTENLSLPDSSHIFDTYHPTVPVIAPSYTHFTQATENIEDLYTDALLYTKSVIHTQSSPLITSIGSEALFDTVSPFTGEYIAMTESYVHEYSDSFVETQSLSTMSTKNITISDSYSESYNGSFISSPTQNIVLSETSSVNNTVLAIPTQFASLSVTFSSSDGHSSVYSESFSSTLFAITSEKIAGSELYTSIDSRGDVDTVSPSSVLTENPTMSVYSSSSVFIVDSNVISSSVITSAVNVTTSSFYSTLQSKDFVATSTLADKGTASNEIKPSSWVNFKSSSDINTPLLSSSSDELFYTEMVSVISQSSEGVLVDSTASATDVSMGNMALTDSLLPSYSRLVEISDSLSEKTVMSYGSMTSLFSLNESTESYSVSSSSMATGITKSTTPVSESPNSDDFISPSASDYLVTDYSYIETGSILSSSIPPVSGLLSSTFLDHTFVFSSAALLPSDEFLPSSTVVVLEGTSSSLSGMTSLLTSDQTFTLSQNELLESSSYLSNRSQNSYSDMFFTPSLITAYDSESVSFTHSLPVVEISYSSNTASFLTSSPFPSEPYVINSVPSSVTQTVSPVDSFSVSSELQSLQTGVILTSQEFHLTTSSFEFGSILSHMSSSSLLKAVSTSHETTSLSMDVTLPTTNTLLSSSETSFGNGFLSSSAQVITSSMSDTSFDLSTEISPLFQSIGGSVNSSDSTMSNLLYTNPSIMASSSPDLSSSADSSFFSTSQKMDIKPTVATTALSQMTPSLHESVISESTYSTEYVTSSISYEVQPSLFDSVLSSNLNIVTTHSTDYLPSFTSSLSPVSLISTDNSIDIYDSHFSTLSHNSIVITPSPFSSSPTLFSSYSLLTDELTSNVMTSFVSEKVSYSTAESSVLGSDFLSEASIFHSKVTSSYLSLSVNGTNSEQTILHTPITSNVPVDKTFTNIVPSSSLVMASVFSNPTDTVSSSAIEITPSYLSQVIRTLSIYNETQIVYSSSASEVGLSSSQTDIQFSPVYSITGSYLSLTLETGKDLVTSQLSLSELQSDVERTVSETFSVLTTQIESFSSSLSEVEVESSQQISILTDSSSSSNLISVPVITDSKAESLSIMSSSVFLTSSTMPLSIDSSVMPTSASSVVVPSSKPLPVVSYSSYTKTMTINETPVIPTQSVAESMSLPSLAGTLIDSLISFTTVSSTTEHFPSSTATVESTDVSTTPSLVITSSTIPVTSAIVVSSTDVTPTSMVSPSTTVPDLSTTPATPTSPATPTTRVFNASKEYWTVIVIVVKASVDITAKDFQLALERKVLSAFILAESLKSQSGRRKRYVQDNNIELEFAEVSRVPNTDDNVKTAYIIRKDGQYVLAEDVSSTMDVLDMQQLAIQLGHVVITKAKPYNAPDVTQTPPSTDSSGDNIPIIIAAVLGSVLGLVVILWAGFCIYSHCFRSKIQQSKEPHLVSMRQPASGKDDEQKPIVDATDYSPEDESHLIPNQGENSHDVTTGDVEEPLYSVVKKNGRPLPKPKIQKSSRMEEKETDVDADIISPVEYTTVYTEPPKPKKPKKKKISKTADVGQEELGIPEDIITSGKQPQVTTVIPINMSPLKMTGDHVVLNIEEEKALHKKTESERKKNKERLRERRRTGEMKDLSESEFKQSQKEIDTLIGDSGGSLPDVFKQDPKKSSKRRKPRAKRDDGILNGSGSQEENSSRVDTLEDARNRMHQLLDEAFSLVTPLQSASDLGNKVHPASGSSESSDEHPKPVPRKRTGKSMKKQDSDDSGVHPNDSDRSSRSSPKTSPVPPADEKKHTPIFVNPAFRENDYSDLTTWTPYRAADQVAMISIPKSPDTEEDLKKKVRKQEKVQTTVFKENLPDSLRRDSIPSPTNAFTDSGTANQVYSKYLEFNGLGSSSSSLKKSPTGSGMSDVELADEESNLIQKAYKERLADGNQFESTGVNNSAFSEHTPPSRKIEDDEIDIFSKSKKLGASPTPLIQSIRSELERISILSKSKKQSVDIP